MTGSSHTKRANALWNNYQTSGDLDLLNETADLLRAALAAARSRRERLSIMSNLAVVLQARYERTDDPEALGESLELLRTALASTDEADPLREAFVLNLAAALRAHYEGTGHLESLLDCIKLIRREVDKPPRPAAQAALQELLSAALQDLYLVGGDAHEMDEAVWAARLAVNLTAPGEAQLRSRLTRLAGALSVRSEACQDMGALDEAIAVAERALALTTPSHPQPADLAANLGVLLHSRFALTASLTDLDHAIALFSRAISAESKPRAATLRNLGAALLSRFDQSGNAHDIDEAVSLHENAVAALPARSPEVSDYLAALGRCRSMRYWVSGRESDISRAITAMEEAVRRTPAEHPRMADYLSALAQARFVRYGPVTNDPAAAMAVNEWQRAASITGAGASVRLAAARSWAEAAAELGDWMSAAKGYETAIGLLPVLLWRSADQRDRSSLHDKLADLPCDAAACMIEIGQPMRALQLLELGRGVLWRWLLGAPTELETLGHVEPTMTDLAAELTRIRNEINHTGVPLVHAPRGAERPVDRRMALAREWDELITRVRSLPGFEDFLRPPRADRLLAVGEEGPVVVVNTSRFRCDALVLRSDGVSVVPLPALTHDEAVGQLNEFLSVVSELGKTPAVSDSLSRERALKDLLAWLWHTVAKRIVDHLSLVAVEGDPAGRLPRIWLCPTGPIAVLPLHAAGWVRSDGSPHGLLDYAVPSYTVTVSRLTEAPLNAAKSEPSGVTNEQPLLVSLAATPGLPGLPTAARELEILTRSAERLQPTILTGSTATTTAVRELLTNRAWVHFSCHAAAAVDEPWLSGIQLYDQRLTLKDVAAQQRPTKQVIVISSCWTSAAGTRIADESVSLAAALQSVGARHVIGALWSVRDESAAVMTDHLYQDVNDFPTDAARWAAQRLHEAVMELRRTNPHVPSVWACFVHYGP